jgi:hypothetical protein
MVNSQERKLLPQSGVYVTGAPWGQLPAVFQMASGYWVSQVVYVAAKLGIADLLADAPKSCEEIAHETGTDCRALFRLMRSLVSLGILAMYPDQRFSLTEIGAPLQSRMPGSMRSMVLTLGDEHYQAWGKLLHSVQSGTPAFQAVYNSPLFEYFERHSEAGDVFNAAMTDFTRQAALAAIVAYDFSGIRGAADIGGGQGAFIRRLLKSNPRMRGILFDSPRVIESAKPLIEAAGLESRCRAIAGDFFESVLRGTDAYILKNVLHDWDDDSAVRILKNCRRAMDDSGKLLVIESLLPASNQVSFTSLLDLNMLVMSGGQERTEAEFGRLFSASGFCLIRVVPTLAPVSILEGVPA